MLSRSQVFSLTSLAFTIIFCSLTCINRFVAITVVRQSIASGTTEGLEWFLPYGWPSVMLAIEILAWGFFFGLSCLSLAPLFGNQRLERWISRTLILIGLLSLADAIGQVSGTLWLSLAGPIAWGPGLTIFVLLTIIWFRKTARLTSSNDEV